MAVTIEDNGKRECLMVWVLSNRHTKKARLVYTRTTDLSRKSNLMIITKVLKVMVLENH